jgi:hypothetical protein
MSRAVRFEDRQFRVAPGLRLEFHKAGERWTHQLSLGAGADEPPHLALLAATVESDPERDDPARVVSPVYQDLQDHPAPEGERALLTGQSTPHHFSAVVTVGRGGPIAVVSFDIADRCRAPIAVLAATYLVPLGSSALESAGPEGILWGGAALGLGRLEFKAGGGGTVALAEAGRQAVRVQALARLDPTTHTQRLLYSWRWTPPD